MASTSSTTATGGRGPPISTATRGRRSPRARPPCTTRSRTGRSCSAVSPRTVPRCCTKTVRTTTAGRYRRTPSPPATPVPATRCAPTPPTGPPASSPGTFRVARDHRRESGLALEPLAGGDPAEVAGYRLHGRLGAGGMGRVYLAFTPGGRPVALKVVRPEFGGDEAFRARFRQEIQAARRVHGLYTAQVLDAGPDADPPWLVTAYVVGPSLAQAVREYGPMPPQTVFQLMAGVAEALQAIHAAGVVHRDLKPSNVLLAPDGPRVIDFGIARAIEATTVTRTGMRVGSPQFMAPEQIAGRSIAPAIDVFALGSLATFAALGRPPFGEGSEAAVMYRILHEPPDLSDI